VSGARSFEGYGNGQAVEGRRLYSGVEAAPVFFDRPQSRVYYYPAVEAAPVYFDRVYYYPAVEAVPAYFPSERVYYWPRERGHRFDVDVRLSGSRFRRR